MLLWSKKVRRKALHGDVVSQGDYTNIAGSCSVKWWSCPFTVPHSHQKITPFSTCFHRYQVDCMARQSWELNGEKLALREKKKQSKNKQTKTKRKSAKKSLEKIMVTFHILPL